MPIRVYSRESSALSSRFFSGLSSAVCSRLFSVVFEVVLQVVLRCIRGYLPGCSPLYSRLSSVVFRVVLQVVLNGLPGCPPDYLGCPLGFPMGCPPGYPPCCLLDCQGYPSDLLVFFQVSSGVFSWVSLMVYKSLGFHLQGSSCGSFWVSSRMPTVELSWVSFEVYSGVFSRVSSEASYMMSSVSSSFLGVGVS